MKVKLLRKVRKGARWILDHKLYKFQTSCGRVVRLSHPSGYEWAFEWMLLERLDYYKDREKIIHEIARRMWNRHVRDLWCKKLRK